MDIVEKTAGALTAGLHGFLSTLIEDYQKALKPSDTIAVASASGSAESQLAAHLKAVEAVFKPPEKEKPKVHINLCESISKLSLERLPQICYPPSALVDALATEVKSKCVSFNLPQGKVPYIYQQVEKYLPSYCCANNYKEEVEEEGDKAEMSKGFEALAKRLGAEEKKKMRLDPLRWSIGFERYALAAAATGQMSLGAALAHKEMCLRMGATVGARMLGVTYDEIVRKAWAERSVCGDVSFDIESAVYHEDPVCLKEAKEKLETAGNQAGQRSVGGPGGKAGGKGVVKAMTCYKCGKEGHKAQDCYSQSQKGGGKKRDHQGKPVNKW